jgi:hypothetical protein
MVEYTINLKGFSETIDVPASITGINAVSQFIAQKLGRKYGQALVRNHPLKYGNKELAISRLAENWMDSHLDFIQDELERLAEDARKELAAT